jgi:hypothetical protein
MSGRPATPHAEARQLLPAKPRDGRAVTDWGLPSFIATEKVVNQWRPGIA